MDNLSAYILIFIFASLGVWVLVWVLIKWLILDPIHKKTIKVFEDTLEEMKKQNSNQPKN